MKKEYIQVKIPEYDICVYLRLSVLYHYFVFQSYTNFPPKQAYIDLKRGVKYLSSRIVKLADEQLEECDDPREQ